jgi:hypothetical protein
VDRRHTYVDMEIEHPLRHDLDVSLSLSMTSRHIYACFLKK